MYIKIVFKKYLKTMLVNNYNNSPNNLRGLFLFQNNYPTLVFIMLPMHVLVHPIYSLHFYMMKKLGKHGMRSNQQLCDGFA